MTANVNQRKLVSAWKWGCQLSVGARGFFLAASPLAFLASPLNSVAPNEKKPSGTQGRPPLGLPVNLTWWPWCETSTSPWATSRGGQPRAFDILKLSFLFYSGKKGRKSKELNRKTRKDQFWSSWEETGSKSSQLHPGNYMYLGELTLLKKKVWFSIQALILKSNRCIIVTSFVFLVTWTWPPVFLFNFSATNISYRRFHGARRHLDSGATRQNLQWMHGNNRDFDPR